MACFWFCHVGVLRVQMHSWLCVCFMQSHFCRQIKPLQGSHGYRWRAADYGRKLSTHDSGNFVGRKHINTYDEGIVWIKYSKLTSFKIHAQYLCWTDGGEILSGDGNISETPFTFFQPTPVVQPYFDNPPPGYYPPSSPYGPVPGAPINHHTTTTVIINQPSPMTVAGPRLWSSDLCSCCDDMGICEYLSFQEFSSAVCFFRTAVHSISLFLLI